MTLGERLVLSGEDATASSGEADGVGVGDVAVAVDSGQLGVDVRVRVRPGLAPWMRPDASQDGLGRVSRLAHPQQEADEGSLDGGADGGSIDPGDLQSVDRS